MTTYHQQAKSRRSRSAYSSININAYILFQITLVLVCVAGVLCQTTKTAECVSIVTRTKNIMFE